MVGPGYLNEHSVKDKTTRRTTYGFQKMLVSDRTDLDQNCKVQPMMIDDIMFYKEVTG